MGKLKICMFAAEAKPYAKAGGLADVVSSLSEALLGQGLDVMVFTPLYREARRHEGVRKLMDLPPVQMGDRSYSSALYFEAHWLPPRNYFIENDEFFDREGIYTRPETGEGYEDNFERFNFFVLSALAALRELQWRPDILHCHDSQAALVPAYLKTGKRERVFFEKVASVLTIHNLAYQGIYGREKFGLTGLPEILFHPFSPFEYHGNLNVMKAGIYYADVLNTVSPQYAKEIQTDADYGAGLGPVLRERSSDLQGILNGIDVREWNPETDPLIYAHFSSEDLRGKLINKQKLQRECGLPELDVPLIGMIGRLADQKGLDLLMQVEKELVALDCQWITLGTGLKKYHDWLQKLAGAHRDRFAVYLKFDNQLAHRIEAGSDMFLMPSHYEPCGLNQMYSMRYGTIPIVRHTGGLADTVREADSGSGTGFKFYDYSANALLEAIQRAFHMWRDKASWAELIRKAMSEDFSWQKSSQQYVELYKRAIEKTNQ